MTSMDEQEVTITVDRAEQMVRVYSAWPAYTRKMRRHPDAIEQRGGDDWGEWTVPLSSFPIARAFRKPAVRVVTERQRQSARAMSAKRPVTSSDVGVERDNSAVEV